MRRSELAFVASIAWVAALAPGCRSARAPLPRAAPSPGTRATDAGRADLETAERPPSEACVPLDGRPGHDITWARDERVMASSTGHLVDMQTRRAERTVPGSVQLSADDRFVAVVDADATLHLRSTQPGAPLERVAENVIGATFEPERARMLLVQEACATRVVRLDGEARLLTVTTAGAAAIAGPAWTRDAVVWASDAELHVVSLAPFGHRSVRLAVRHLEVPAADGGRESSRTAAINAFHVGSGLIGAVDQRWTLHVFDASSGALRWSRPDIAQFVLSSDGSRIGVLEPVRDPDNPDARVRILDARDGRVLRARDVPPSDLVGGTTDGRSDRFAGMCGRGALDLSSVDADTVVLGRLCAVSDSFEYDLAADRIATTQHGTPERDARDAESVARACRASGIAGCDDGVRGSATWFDADRIAVITTRSGTHLVDVPRRKRLSTLDATVAEEAVRPSPRGTYAYARRASEGDVLVWDVRTGKRVLTLHAQ